MAIGKIMTPQGRRGHARAAAAAAGFMLAALLSACDLPVTVISAMVALKIETASEWETRQMIESANAVAALYGLDVPAPDAGWPLEPDYVALFDGHTVFGFINTDGWAGTLRIRLYDAGRGDERAILCAFLDIASQRIGRRFTPQFHIGELHCHALIGYDDPAKIPPLPHRPPPRD